MKIHILGCGGAPGVPSISRGWGNCDPKNEKNKRTRTSAFLQTNDKKNILIDTSPDLRQQLLNANIRQIDAVLYTHEHADHTHGIDDIREINRISKSPIDIYANQNTLELLENRFSYAFDEFSNKDTVIFRPWLKKHKIDEEQIFHIGKTKITPLKVNHGWINALAYKFNENIAYVTDAVEIYEQAFHKLNNLDVLIIGCMTLKKHITHADLDKILIWVDKLKPKMTYLTHMGTSMDYQNLCEILPNNIRPSYDGMVIDIS